MAYFTIFNASVLFWLNLIRHPTVCHSW